MLLFYASQPHESPAVLVVLVHLPRVVVGLAVLCLAAAHCSRFLVWKARRRRAVTQRSHNAPCLFAVWSRFTQEKIARLSARSTRGVFGDLWAVRLASVSRKSEKRLEQNGLLAACKTLEMDRALLEFSAPAQRCRSDACAARRDPGDDERSGLLLFGHGLAKHAAESQPNARRRGTTPRTRQSKAAPPAAPTTAATGPQKTTTTSSA